MLNKLAVSSSLSAKKISNELFVFPHLMIAACFTQYLHSMQ